MRKVRKRKSVFTLVLAMAVCIGIMCSEWIPLAAKESISHTSTMDSNTMERLKEILDYPKEAENYSDYIEKYDSNVRPDEKIVIEAADFLRAEGMEPKVLTDYEGNRGASLYTEEDGLVEYAFTVEKEGFYQLCMEYYPVEGNSAAIQRSFFVDGALPCNVKIYIESEKLTKIIVPYGHKTFVNYTYIRYHIYSSMLYHLADAGAYPYSSRCCVLWRILSHRESAP